MKHASLSISILLLLGLGIAVPAEAAMLDLIMEYPVLVTFDLQVQYDPNGSGDGVLTAVGAWGPGATCVQTYSADGVPANEVQFFGSLDLVAIIDKTDKTPVAGHLEILSDLDQNGSLETVRASSDDLAEFGFDDVGAGLFSFWFVNATGDLTTSDDRAGVILASMAPGFDTSFAQSYSNYGFGKADIPEPATAGLIALGGVAILLRRRSRRSR